MTYDVIVIGAGVTGSAVARELSRYDVKTVVLEKEGDVCEGTSKANSAIVHAGYDCVPASMMAKMNVRGNEMMGPLARDLDVPFERIGSLLICTHAEGLDALDDLYERGLENGVKGMRLLFREEVLAMEPALTEDVVAALWAPSAGIVCPFTLTIALAENACQNGVEFRLDTRVRGVSHDGRGIWHVETSRGECQGRCVVNAAGLHADTLHNMVSDAKIHITPRRGDYLLLDRGTEGLVHHVIFSQPTAQGKGVLVTPTVHGNTLIGPTAIDLPDDEKDNIAITQEGLDQVCEKASRSVRAIPFGQVITSFAGLRAHEDQHEFIIGPVADAPGFIDCAGIESPGLTSSPAIGAYVASLVRELLKAREKPGWVPTRTGILNPTRLSLEERNELIRREPAYGQIVCRCESVSEGEILDCIRRPLGARSLDGVKRRVRAGMGRCQGGFCSSRVMDILSRELGVPLEEITKSGGASYVVSGRDKAVQA